MNNCWGVPEDERIYGDAWSACRCLPCASSYHCKPLCSGWCFRVVSVLSRMAVCLRASAIVRAVGKGETPAAPGVGLPRRIIPPPFSPGMRCQSFRGKPPYQLR